MSRAVMQKVLSSLMNLQPIIANGLLDKRQLAFIDPHLDVACEALIAELAQPDHIPDAGKMVKPVELEAVYETIIQWDEGGGRRSRRELARRILALYATHKKWAVGQELSQRMCPSTYYRCGRGCGDGPCKDFDDAYDIKEKS